MNGHDRTRASAVPREAGLDGNERPFRVISLSAQFRDVEQVDALFGHVPRWGIDRLIVLPLDWARAGETDFWRGLVPPLRHWTSFPFGNAAMPELAARRDPGEANAQLEIMDTVYIRCVDHGVEFMPSIVLPKFALNDVDDVRRAHPQLFDRNGLFRLESTAYLPMLESILDEIRDRYPRIAGFELRFSEGSSANIRQYSLDDLNRIDEWLPLWTTFAEVYGRRHGLEMMVFAHHYHASRGTRRRLHGLLARHPSLWVLEDLTWPQEHVSLPYLGYLGEEWTQRLARDNPLCVNLLLDTEYMGQGRLPAVLPGWWQGGLRHCRAMGVAGVNGRVMRWDRSDTLQTWNLLNVDLFCALAHDPDADAEQLLRESVARRFGADAGVNALTDALLESERLIQLQTLNGVDFADHSGFPPPKHLHRDYFESPLKMLAVSDLFSPQGTALHAGATDALTADKEWREQLRIVARDSAEYVNAKTVLVERVKQLNEDIARISATLQLEDRAFVTTSYALWLLQARAFQLFTKVAASHAEWIAAECGIGGALDVLSGFGDQLDELAAETSERFGENALFDLAPRLRAMARFVRDPVPVGRDVDRSRA